MYKIILIGVFSLVLLSSCFSSKEDNSNTIIFAYIPNRDVNELEISANKIASFLSKDTGYKVKTITVQNYAGILFGLAREKIDLAFVGPLDYILCNDKTGAYPITSSVRHGIKGYRGIGITHRDNNISSLKDLKGRSVAFGDPLSASSNLYPKWKLKEYNIDTKIDIKSIYLSSAASIVLSVLNKKVDVGFIYNDARTSGNIMKKFPKVLNDTKIIFTTDIIPADPQIVRKNLEKYKVVALQRALVKMSNDIEGKKWLHDLFGIDRLEIADETEYFALKEIVMKLKPELLER